MRRCNIGRYLGGRWDPQKLTLHVKSVFPCSLNNPQDQVECTVLQNKIRELIAQQVLAYRISYLAEFKLLSVQPPPYNRHYKL